MESRKRSALVMVGRPALVSALIVGFYYLIPVEPGVRGAQLALRVAGTAVLGLLITWRIMRQVGHHLSEPETTPVAGLLTALVGGVAFFALADYTTAILGPGQFVELETKTDALYFAVATLTTVGYGDVHAAGQVARAVVIAQLVFNVAVIATGASVLSRQISTRARERRAAAPPR
jgi:voltage-gated potassium channel